MVLKNKHYTMIRRTGAKPNLSLSSLLSEPGVGALTGFTFTLSLLTSSGDTLLKTLDPIHPLANSITITITVCGVHEIKPGHSTF